MQAHAAEHLPKYKKIQLGGYYTPEKLVTRVYNSIQPYLLSNKKNVVIFDSAGGCGAFLINISRNDYRIADCDNEACAFLRQRFDTNKIFHTNSLIEVHRELGPGLLESTYERCLAREFELQNISAEFQKPMKVRYKGA